jgi:hypothetical protein
LSWTGAGMHVVWLDSVHTRPWASTILPYGGQERP